MKTVSKILFVLAASVTPTLAASPTWDSSGNNQLNGTYYFRQVLYAPGTGGSISGAAAFYGNITFTGATGTYTASGAAFESPNAPATYSTTGTYSVSASGFGFMTSPLATVFPTGDNINLYFLMSNGILIGSDTESGYNDMLVAAPSAALTNSSFNGAYTISAFIPGGSPAASLDATYQLNPNGAGVLGTVSITGFNGNGTSGTQSSSGVKYSFVNGANVITFPTSASANFYSGQEYMYLSPDSKFVFGGSPSGFDMFVGVRNVSSGTSTPLLGLYYEAGFDDNEASGLDSYYGVLNAFPLNGTGNVVGHERLLYSGYTPEGYTYYDDYPTTISGTYTDTATDMNYTIGQDGIRVGFGTNGYLAIEVALPYTPPAATGSVYVDPTGIVNSASSAPYTAGISPGEFITLYNGVNLSNSNMISSTLPTLTTSLSGVTVLVDGIAAPLYYVSPAAISLVVPYEVSAYPIASIQVNNNGVMSNTVTTYVHQTTPGVFTIPEGGIYVAAMDDYPASGGPHYIVSTSNPAQPGDTVAVYLTGLGTPFPANTDGIPGGVTCVTGICLVNGVSVDVGGVGVGTLAFAGQAPDEASGLYQINFQIPPICVTSTSTGCLTTAGNYSMDISGLIAGTGGALVGDSYTAVAYVPVGSGIASAARVATGSPGATVAKATPAAHRAPPLFREANAPTPAQ